MFTLVLLTLCAPLFFTAPMRTTTFIPNYTLTPTPTYEASGDLFAEDTLSSLKLLYEADEQSNCKYNSFSGKDLNFVETERIARLIRMYGRKKYLKHLVKRQTRKSDSFLRKMFGKAIQSPKDSSLKEGMIDTYRKIPLEFVKSMSDMIGTTSSLISYLWSFGYIASVVEDEAWGNSSYQVTPCDIIHALKAYQRFNNLEETGKLDARTVKKLGMARCGVGDFDKGCKNNVCRRHREKRYAVRIRRWKTTELNYYVFNCSRTMSERDCKGEIEKGMSSWSYHSPIIFREVANKDDAHLYIAFISGPHEKHRQFDGPYGVLGHAGYPRKGHIHLDNDEKFTRDTNDGVNLQYVFTHELGHALGVMHSKDEQAIMSPAYDADEDYRERLRFSRDDIMAIQAMFGRGRGKVIPRKR